ncbi:MAG TPA: O-antigen ligase family protein [Gammaproteobacteria bacterium]|nr:O-antigen ligase family protein [Gammaproteobacteria bacterium]
MSLTVSAMGVNTLGTRKTSLSRISLYLLAIAICVPTDLFSTSLLGNRQLLVPVATLLVVFTWLILKHGRMPAVRGNISIIWIALFLFTSLAVLSSVSHPNSSQSLQLVATYMVRFIMLFALVQSMVADTYVIMRVQRLLAGALALVALLMISGLLDHFGHNVLSSAIGSNKSIARISAGLGDPNFTALAFNNGLAMALAWFATAETRSRRIAAVVAALLLVVGIGRTVSIGGLIGMTVILLLAYWRMAKFAGRRKWGLMWLSVGLLAAIVAVAGGVYMKRIDQQAVRSERSLSSLGTERLNLTVGGLRMAWANPLLGVGVANISEFMPQYLLTPIAEPYQESHDGFINVMDEMGIPAFLLFLLVVLLVFRLAIAAQRHLLKIGDRTGYLVGEGACIALIANLVQTLALGTQRFPHFWFVIALVLATSWRALHHPGTIKPAVWVS